MHYRTWINHANTILKSIHLFNSDKALYTNKSRCLLDNIKLPAGVMSCTDNRCTDITHRYELDILYTDICSALYEAGLASIPSSDCNSSNQHVVPGWNEYVRDSHTEARHAYVTWRDFGKPRQGPVHELMRSTRLRFKYALRQCQSRQETARADALARNLSSKDMTSFWKSIKTINNKRIPLASTINGVTGEHDISELWKDHYSGILNCVHSDTNKAYVESILSTINNTECHIIKPHDISDAISNLKCGKSVGYDLLAAEQLTE